MKVLILNGSPTPNGNTVRLIESFTKGAEESGSEVARLDLNDYMIAPFRGMKQPEDDFEKYILPELMQADIFVFASPLYWMDFTSQLKLVFDRMSFTGVQRGRWKACALIATANSPREWMEKTIYNYYRFTFIENGVQVKDYGAVLSYGDRETAAAYELGKSIK